MGVLVGFKLVSNLWLASFTPELNICGMETLLFLPGLDFYENLDFPSQKAFPK